MSRDRLPGHVFGVSPKYRLILLPSLPPQRWPFPPFFRTHPPLPSCSLWYSTACVLCALLAMPGAQNLSFATVSGSAIPGSHDLTNNCATGGLVCCCLFVFVS